MARGTRTRLATGIYRDAYGCAVVVNLAGQPHERRYPADTSIETLQQKRAQLKAELEDDLPAAPAPDTLAADVVTYLRTLPAKSRRRKSAATELRQWTAVFGRKRRTQLTALQITTQLAAWAAAGKAASTLNKRRQELINLFDRLGPKSKNPARETQRYTEPEPEPRGFPLLAVAYILGALPRGKTQVRLRVIATTSIPHAQIAKIQPAHFDADARTLYVTQRRKGKGAKGRTLRLTRRGVAAVKALLARQANAPFSRHAMATMFRAAVAKAKARWQRYESTPWPVRDDVRPYDFRHAFLSEVYRRSRDLRAVKEIGLHAQLVTSERYVESVVSETVDAAIAALDGATPARRMAPPKHREIS